MNDNLPEYKLSESATIYKNYYLTKENIEYKFMVGKGKSDIFIKYQKYKIILNNNDLSKITKLLLNNLDDAYNFIVNLFENQKVIIEVINFNDNIRLKLKIDDEKYFELILVYNKDNKDSFYKITVSKNSYAKFAFDNSFCVFKSYNDIYYIIYSNEIRSIICFDLNNNKNVNEIKNAHKAYITSFRHYLDETNKRDLILSISGENNNLKLWNIVNFECLLNIINVNKVGTFLSACFLKDNNENYIISSNRHWTNNEFIKVFDFNGNKIKELNGSNDATFFIDVYYEDMIYILTGNENYVKSLNYNKNEIYHIYNDKSKSFHRSIVINNKEQVIKLIESSDNGIIRIWNFHTGLLLNKIKVSDNYLCGISLLNKDHLFVGCFDGTIKLVDLNKGTVINLYKHNHSVITVKIFICPKYGKFLISQGLLRDEINIWINNLI